MVEACGTALLGKRRNTLKSMVRKHEGKRPSGRPRGKWDDNIKIVIIEIRRVSVDLINFAQDR
jgi:hypothetical protein